MHPYDFRCTLAQIHTDATDYVYSSAAGSETLQRIQSGLERITLHSLNAGPLIAATHCQCARFNERFAQWTVVCVCVCLYVCPLAFLNKDQLSLTNPRDALHYGEGNANK